MTERRDSAGFVIRSLDSWIIAAGSVRLVETSVPRTELRMAWEEIRFVRLTLHADQLIIEGDSAMVVAWLQGDPDFGMVIHPLVHDIHYLLQECVTCDIKYVYYETNSTVD